MVNIGQLLDLNVTVNYGVEGADFDGLALLNYSMIDTPKNDIHARACRGHIINAESGEYYCRPFDRFFNYGEMGTENFIVDWSKVEIAKKIDGSLIKVWYNPLTKLWYAGTRGTFNAGGNIGGLDITFEQLVFKAIGVDDFDGFNQWAEHNFSDRRHCTHLFELTSPHNRVVTPHTCTTLWSLACRNNITGQYLPVGDISSVTPVPKYDFSSIDDLLAASKELPFDDEGYVAWIDNCPAFKLKSPAYVAVHHMRGGGQVTVNQIINLILTNEVSEYLSYFPEMEEMMLPYMIAYEKISVFAQFNFERIKHMEQKEFAMEATKHPFSGILFSMKKGMSYADAFERMTPNSKQNLIKAMI